jgi:sulfite oxidase
MSFRFAYSSSSIVYRRLVSSGARGGIGARRPISQRASLRGNPGKRILLAIGGLGVLGFGLWTAPLTLHAEPAAQPTKYRRGDVAAHTSVESRIWVTYQDGVYDVTEFAGIHPGGERILLAAGKAIDPYWAVFAIHNSQETKDLLEGYRIGSLLPADKDPTFDPNQGPDPGLASLFSNDPERHPSLITRSARPRNAEAAPESLESFITPNALFYVRNHLPVPQIRTEEYSLEIDGPGIPADKKYSLQELKENFPKTEVMATIQCAGNRRAAMHEVKPVKGLLWDLGAIGNAVWAGECTCLQLYCELKLKS